MSAKRWADEYSSDEGSIDPESDEESVTKSAPTATKAPAPTKNLQNPQTTPTPSTRQEQFIAYISSINSSASRKDVGQFFEERSCAILNLDVHTAHGRNSTATMEFKDANSLSIALSLNGENFMGIPIRTKVFEVRVHQQHQPNQRQQPQQGGRGSFRDNRDAFRGPARNEDDRFPGRRQEGARDGGRGRGGSSRERPTREVQSASAPPVPATRPKLNLAPRTLPVDLIGKAVADETKPDIFGGGRPHDDVLYEEKKKIVEPKQDTDKATPDTVFELQGLKASLPLTVVSGESEDAESQPAAPQPQQATTNADARPSKGGRGVGSQGGRGSGRESGERWSKEAPRQGRGGGATGSAGGRGSGRTVEVTGSYVIEKPVDDDESSKGGSKGPKSASSKKSAPVHEDGRAAAGKAGKSGPGARENREHRQAQPDGATGPNDSAEGRPKSGAASAKLFNSAMKQASHTAKPKKLQVTGATAGSSAPTDEEKFHKAQEKLAGRGEYRGVGSGSTPTAASGVGKKTNSFAALNLSDSEDE